LRSATRQQIKSDHFVALVLTTQESFGSRSISIDDSLIFDQQVQERGKLTNVVGILPGKGNAGEDVIFSAHYDHLGVGRPNAKGDSIYNGANDDASGVTAVILLARYFSQYKNNARTLVFAAFTAEEIGEYGSKYFSGQFDPDAVMAMFNIEMIGSPSKWGSNSAFITGYDRTDMGKILGKNLAGSAFTFSPIPTRNRISSIVPTTPPSPEEAFPRTRSPRHRLISTAPIIHPAMRSVRWT
jgi:Zn-dependent M28 family amino/carboxypeptidase